ncbi:heat shock factor-type DNA-binding domain-containing protein [Trichoderma citrinoviride]|uniref:Heat shock factor-type DNA-binding domain-containing protein n=1 Tax=Trichoderma citrinoviride TaxID=58853 RepID=A0A2T4B3U7_9HYPO|nr:heat shock factor-type DNA-binding domain-containing protein [Trichoderma citrinoviride]PTB63898.1 heat shock factor-type DNA-binding domain-containing protein [Trichoderma citrinoviride]
MSAPNSRKRAAPGSSPIVPIQRNMQQPYEAEPVAVANPAMPWGGIGGVPDATDYFGAAAAVHGENPYGLAQAPPAFPPAVSTPSTSLARRQMNRALVPTNLRAAYDASADRWSGFGDDGLLVPQNATDGAVGQDSIEVLEEMAQKAKREAQAKRKQIPPFVQKLSRQVLVLNPFLEERKNEDLIRWSEKGDSFIVLDEDEFAKTLIPELFKHNNYASFVRQLNMYGFHKCVGLSDNSMRASERKNKSPSEYSNPYFRRGHPNLLWLINKPKSGGKSKKGNKGQDADGDSEEDGAHEEIASHPGAPVTSTTGRSLPAVAGTEAPPLPKKEMALIKEELQKVREQQKLILGAINRLQRNNNDLYNQALMFQSQHDRHQNSINAILNFLANVFRKTLEDQGASQNVTDIISSLMANQNQQPQHQGSVVDLGDFFHGQGDAGARKSQKLLPPIPQAGQHMAPPSRTPSTSSSVYHPVGAAAHPEMGHVTELLDTSPSDTTLRQELEANPHERMMKIINDHNASSSAGLDLPEAAEIVNNAPSTLSNDQRSTLVNLIAAQTTSPPMPATPAVTDPLTHVPSTAASSAMPSPAQEGATAAPPSLSPIMRSPTMPAPSLQHISSNQSELEQLKRLQSEQDAKIHELSGILGPLSPSGQIPGLDDGNEAYFDPPNVDLDQFFDSSAFLNDAHFGDGTDFNFNLDAEALNNGINGGINSGVNGGLANGINNHTPSPTGTEEIPRDGFGLNDSPSHGNKRRRIG